MLRLYHIQLRLLRVNINARRFASGHLIWSENALQLLPNTVGGGESFYYFLMEMPSL
jgi:hypothetical protein